jgi:hypothetical protein
MTTAITKLKSFLQTGNNMELSLAEREVSFDLIFETKRKPFCNVQNESELLSSIAKLTKRFIDVNFAGDNSTDIAMQFSIDIVEIKPDWNLLDILNFFKFIRQRQDLPECKIFGNKISPIKLLELSSVYEEYKSIAREIWQKKEISTQVYGTIEQKKQILIGTGEQFKDTRFKDLANDLNQKLNSDRDKIYENANKTKQFLRDIQKNWEELMEAVSEDKISEEEAIYQHHKYRLEWGK